MPAAPQSGQAAAPPPQGRWLLAGALLVLLLTLVAHAPALHGTGFTLDDIPIVAENPRLDVRGWDDLLALLRSDYWGDPLGEERLWRPLALLTFAAERRLHGGHPDGYHALNALLHGLAAGLSLWLFLPALGSRRAALLGALLFALHPVHAEATAGVVGRSEVLALLLVLLALLSHRAGFAPGPRSRLRAVAGVLCAGLAFFLAFTAKEIALTGPFLLAVFQLATRTASPPAPAPAPAPEAGRLRRWLRVAGRGLRAAAPWLVYLLALLAYLGLRWWVLGDVVARGGARTVGLLDLSQRALLACLLHLDALLSLLVPHASSAHYPFGGARLDPLVALIAPGRVPPGPGSPSWGAPLAAPLLGLHLVLGLGALLALRRPRGWLRAAGLGLLGFYLALGPISNLIPIGVLRADRLLYTPSWWWCLMAAALLMRALRGRSPRTVAVVAAVLLGPCAGLLAHNARTWTDDQRLWEESLRLYPGEPRIQVARAKQHLRAGEQTQALGLLRQAVAGSPPGEPLAAESRAFLGLALLGQGRDPEAEHLLVEARGLDPRSTPAVLGLSQLYLQRAERAARAADPQGQQRWTKQAAGVLVEGTRFTRDYQVWVRLGWILSGIPGREPEAEAAYEQAIRLSAAPWQALLNRGVLRLNTGRAQEALGDLRRAAQLLEPPRTAEQARFLREATRLRGQVAAGLGLAEEARACEQQLAAPPPGGG